MALSIEERLRELELFKEQYMAGRLPARSALGPGVVEAKHLKAGSVNADKLTAGAVNAEAIAADAVTAEKINVTELESVSANTGDLSVTGTITVDGAGSVIVGDPLAQHAELTETGMTVAGNQTSPFLSLEDTDGSNPTDVSIGPYGLTWVTDDGVNAKVRVMTLDRIVLAGTGVGHTDFLGPNTVHALVMVACYDISDGSVIGHIFGSTAANGELYAVSSVTSASNGSATAPSIEVPNGSDGIQFFAHATKDTRFIGLIVVAYAD